MSDPLTIARDYVELYDREHAEPNASCYTLAGLEDDIAMARYIIEQHGKHERLRAVLRDLCLFASTGSGSLHDFAQQIARLVTP